MGIVVLAIFFGPYIAISMSLIKRTYVRLTRKLKISYHMLCRNFRRSGKHRFDQNSAKIAFIPVFGIFSIVSFINLLGVHILTFSLLGILLLQNKEMISSL
jgi:hypothetical protein